MDHVIHQYDPKKQNAIFAIWDTRAKLYYAGRGNWSKKPKALYDTWKKVRAAKTRIYNTNTPKYQGVLWVVEIGEAEVRKNPASMQNQLWRKLADFVITLRTANRAQLEDAIVGLKQGSADYGLPATDRAIYKKLLPLLRKELRDFGPKREKYSRLDNPSRRKKITKKELSVMDKHQLAIARKTLTYSDAGALIMGGPTKAEAREIIKKLTGKVPRENPSRRKTKKKTTRKKNMRKQTYSIWKVGSGLPRETTGLATSNVFNTKAVAKKYCNEHLNKRGSYAIVSSRLTSVGVNKLLSGKR